MQMVTSIPPRYAGPDLDYTTACVDSWRRCGFDPISLNRPDEVAAVERLGLLEVRAVATEEAWEPKRFGPPLGSVFDFAHPDEPLAIINADIYMMGVPELSAKLAEICHKGVVAARRTDVSALGVPTGEAMLWGYDLFAFVKNAIPRTIADSRIRRFQLGAPWLDYIAPAAASFEASAFRVVEPFLIHRIHKDHWDRDIWRRLSGEARHILEDVAPAEFRTILEKEKRLSDNEVLVANACIKWLFDGPVFQPIRLPTDGPDPFFSSLPRLIERKRLPRKLFSFRKLKAFVQGRETSSPHDRFETRIPALLNRTPDERTAL